MTSHTQNRHEIDGLNPNIFCLKHTWWHHGWCLNNTKSSCLSTPAPASPGTCSPRPVVRPLPGKKWWVGTMKNCDFSKKIMVWCEYDYGTLSIILSWGFNDSTLPPQVANNRWFTPTGGWLSALGCRLINTLSNKCFFRFLFGEPTRTNQIYGGNSTNKQHTWESST